MERRNLDLLSVTIYPLLLKIHSHGTYVPTTFLTVNKELHICLSFETTKLAYLHFWGTLKYFWTSTIAATLGLMGVLNLWTFHSSTVSVFLCWDHISFVNFFRSYTFRFLTDFNNLIAWFALSVYIKSYFF